jgi:divalent metal cation (Fe/Co/Zn/Cd) transporter
VNAPQVHLRPLGQGDRSTAPSVPIAGDLTTVGLVARARMLEWLTICWLAVEATVATVASLTGGSVALLGFGLGSLIELCSALVVLWRVRGTGSGGDAAEQTTQKLIAACFAALAVYLVIEATQSLISDTSTRISWAGSAIAAASIVVMPILARAKRRIARDLRSAAISGDAAQSWLCALTAAAVLYSAAAQSLLGWSWIDPLVAIGIAALATREAWEAWNGDGCAGRLATASASRAPRVAYWGHAAPRERTNG